MNHIRFVFTLLIALSSPIFAAEMNQMTKEQAYTILSQASKKLANSSSSEKEIKTAYKKALLKWHPDQNQAQQEKATETTKWINAAYDIITGKSQPAPSSNPSTSQEHDEFLEANYKQNLNNAINNNQKEYLNTAYQNILQEIIEIFEKNKTIFSKPFMADVYFRYADLKLKTALEFTLNFEEQDDLLESAQQYAAEAQSLEPNSEKIKVLIYHVQIKEYFYKELWRDIFVLKSFKIFNNPYYTSKYMFPFEAENKIIKEFFFQDSKDFKNLEIDENIQKMYIASKKAEGKKSLKFVYDRDKIPIPDDIDNIIDKVTISDKENENIRVGISDMIALVKYYLAQIYLSKKKKLKQAQEYLLQAKEYFNNPKMPNRSNLDLNQYSTLLQNRFVHNFDMNTTLQDIETKLKEIKNLRISCVIQ